MAIPIIKPSSDGVALMAISVVAATLATTAMILRLWARRLMRIALGLDDYLALASLIVYYGELIFCFLHVLYAGTGTDETDVLMQSPTAMSYNLKVCLQRIVVRGYNVIDLKTSTPAVNVFHPVNLRF